MLALSHDAGVALSLATVAVVVLVVGLIGGYWARRGSDRRIIRDDGDERN